MNFRINLSWLKSLPRTLQSEWPESVPGVESCTGKETLRLLLKLFPLTHTLFSSLLLRTSFFQLACVTSQVVTPFFFSIGQWSISYREHIPHIINVNCLRSTEFAIFIIGEEEGLSRTVTVRVCITQVTHSVSRKWDRCAWCSPWSLFGLYCEAGHGYRLCHLAQNPCHESSVVLDCMFNPGHVVKDVGIDANISSQNTAICKSQDPLQDTIADCWCSCDFLPGERKPGYLSGTHKESRANEGTERTSPCRAAFFLARCPSTAYYLWSAGCYKHSGTMTRR